MRQVTAQQSWSGAGTHIHTHFHMHIEFTSPTADSHLESSEEHYDLGFMI